MIYRITPHTNKWVLITFKNCTIPISLLTIPLFDCTETTVHYSTVRLDSKLDDQDMNECLFIFMVHHKFREMPGIKPWVTSQVK